MQVVDQFGYDVSLSDKSRLESWNACTMAFLAHSAETPKHMTGALKGEPDFAMAYATLGLFNMLLGRRELCSVAFKALEKARQSRLMVGATARESAYVDALEAWVDGWPSKAAAILEGAAVNAPRDALLIKLIHAIRFVLGQPKQMRASLEAVLPHYEPTDKAWGYINGCYAFALEETGEYARAEKIGRDAVSHTPDDAWGLHAVAHVYDMTGRADHGVRWLDENPSSWAHCNNFGYHVWWHLALMHLDNGNIDRVLMLYDERIRKDKTDDYRDISNAASLLVRLEIEGASVGNRWEELADLSEHRVADACNVFADLHYFLALCGDDRTRAMDMMMNRMRDSANVASDEPAVITRDTGLATAQGLAAYRDGKYFSAFHALNQARPHLIEVGGSHAQRDVFERLTIEAALRAGLSTEAKRLLDQRLALRSAPDAFSESRLPLAERMSSASQVMQDESLRARWG
ncbi:tetratricopeptide repeat protein [Rhodobacteraceae bacterium RKSG542]|uniref:tetratricopeptide repeat protein n=1 Tax=Pseudovibrio flavus TaxID=2529854 RepID=UPI0012BCFA14|nr:tetratricopeptide repeat protein [Pseudovibrio flavus]MTI17696.1 tetratricopeptide repeat protein [Pseudovibrio flavus]